MAAKDSADGSELLKKEVASVGKHSGVYVIGQGLSRAVGFFMIPIYTKFIAPNNYGAMEMIQIIGSSLALSVSMGAGHAMYRYYRAARLQEDKNLVVSTIFICFALTGIPIVLTGQALSSLISRAVLDTPEFHYLLQLTFVTVWFGMFCDFGFSYLRMLYRAKTFVLVTTAQLVIGLSLNIWFVVYLRLDILGIFYSNLITQSVIGLSLAVWVLRRVGLRVDFTLYRKLVRFGLPLVPSRIGLMLGFVSNRFFLRWLSSPDPVVALSQVGLYTLGHKFSVIISRFVNVPFNSFWAPRRMELLFDDEEGSKPIIARICTYAMVCSLYLALFLSSGIENVIAIVADPRYEGAHVVVPFVTLAYVFLGLEHHFVAGILYKKKTIWSTYASFASLSIILVLNYVLIPIYGLIGAASAMLIGIVIRVAIVYTVSQRVFPIAFEMRRLFTMLVTAVGLFFATQLVTTSSHYATFLLRMSMVALFPVILLAVGFFRRGEIEVGLRLLRRASRKVRTR